MYFAEHRYLGNSLELPEHDAANSGDKSAKQNPFTLENGLVTTYGEINGFSGDYFGLENPISLIPMLEDRKLKFKRWFDLLGKEQSGKPKAEALRAELKDLNDKADAAISSGKDEELSKVYTNNPLNITKLDNVSTSIPRAPGASFMDLLKTNVDHFGPEARVVYNVGHAVALETAANGELQKAYALNAFADHFLEDSFASGHMRTPRRQLYEIGKKGANLFAPVINASSNVMHEEDGKVGLWSQSPSGERWKSYGDGRLPDHISGATSTALGQCQKALAVSVKEVHNAYTSKQVIVESQFGAWQHAPILETISTQPENHTPLLQIKGDNIYYRTGGIESKNYTEIKSPLDWGKFYIDNFSLVEGQVLLWLKQQAPWLGNQGVKLG